MLHFKQLSNSSAPPPCRKTPLPQNIKILKTVKYRALTGAKGQTSIIKSTGCLSHLFCITPLPHDFWPYSMAENLNSLQERTQKCSCYLLHVLHPSCYLLSNGKALYEVEHFSRVLFGGIIYILRFPVSTRRQAFWGSPYIDHIWTELGWAGGGVTGI